MPGFSDLYQAALKGSKTDLPDTVMDLSGKTVIVTGSNGGLGKELAAKLLAMNPAKLVRSLSGHCFHSFPIPLRPSSTCIYNKIIAARSLSKGESARQELLASYPSASPSSVEVWSLDMADFASVKAFTERANATLDRIDVLVCNAGVWPAKFEKTKDGWETW